MIVTRVNITAAEGHSPTSCLLGFADVELDGVLVIHSMRIIQKTQSAVFIDFPSRPAPSAFKCLRCGKRPDCLARYCSFCGERKLDLEEPKYKNLVHPINSKGRAVIHDAIIHAYKKYKSQQPTTSAIEDGTEEPPEFALENYIENRHEVAT